ncbi:MAG: hypothetical protein JSR65_01830 [Proteobacteria bacterium]|nr:hypothetical protein [Pseudomonadota bacterium]
MGAFAAVAVDESPAQPTSNSPTAATASFATPGWHPPLRPPQELAAIQYANGLPAGEGPFVGGAFARPKLTAQELDAYWKSVTDALPKPRKLSQVGELLFDARGDSNELIVQTDIANPGFLRLLTQPLAEQLTTSRLEDLMVHGIESGDARLATNLFGAIDARYVIDDERLDNASRAALDVDAPEERLHRAIVLRYPSVDAAASAKGQLRSVLGDATVETNRKITFSYTPNDKYYANSSSSNPYYVASNEATYQWGLQAMRFPSAWDTTFGSGYVGIVGSVSWGTAIYVPAYTDWRPPFATTPAHTDYKPNPPADLQANYRQQFSKYLSGDTTNEPHDTHTAGIVAATTNNNLGVAGACPNCSLAMMQSVNHADIAPGILGLVRRGV